MVRTRHGTQRLFDRIDGPVGARRRIACAASDEEEFGAAAVLLTLAHAWRRANAPLGRIEAAARGALRIRPGDPTLEPVRAQIRAMRARAFELEAARRACVLRLRRLDHAAFEGRGSVQEPVEAADSVEVFASIADPRVEAARLERIRAASLDGLKR